MKKICRKQGQFTRISAGQITFGRYCLLMLLLTLIFALILLFTSYLTVYSVHCCAQKQAACFL